MWLRLAFGSHGSPSGFRQTGSQASVLSHSAVTYLLIGPRNRRVELVWAQGGDKLLSRPVSTGVLEPRVINRWGYRRGYGAGTDVPNDVECFLERMVHAQHVVPTLSLLC